MIAGSDKKTHFTKLLRQYLVAFLFTLTVTLFCYFIEVYVGYRAIGFIFLLTVVTVGLLSSMGVVIFTAALCTFIWNFFFISPKFTFLISNADDFLMCLTFFVVASAIGFLTRHIREREEKLAEAQRLKESEELHQTLLNCISHEMRTPLTAILSSAWALEDENMIRDTQYVKSAALTLQDAGERLNRVIENLLDMSRLDSGVLSLKLEWHDVHDLIGVVRQKSAKALSKHRLNLEIEEQLPLIKMDFRLLEHAVSNLLINARLYTPENSEIKISVKELNKNLLIDISDEGRGIPKEYLPKIFDKFFRVPGSPTGGTGLGLSIVKSIVNLHKGQVDVKNRTPHGASFIISLPIEKQPQLPLEVPHE